jgi:hypothetical protein
MKIYLALGESRSFDFSAIGLTEEEATHAIIETFKAHARHYSLPLDWWKENADYFVMGMETGYCYRDRSQIDSVWYYPQTLSDEEIEQGFNTCDCCEVKAKTIDMFWSVGECETERQRQAVQFMENNGYEMICMDCYENIEGDFNHA